MRETTVKLLRVTPILSLLLVCAPSAKASPNTYLWFSSDTQSCWQAGVYPASQMQCTTFTAPGYLNGGSSGIPHAIGNVNTNAFFDQTQIAPYCNYFDGQGTWQSEPSQDGSQTGFSPPSPYSSYTIAPSTTVASEPFCQAGIDPSGHGEWGFFLAPNGTPWTGNYYGMNTNSAAPGYYDYQIQSSPALKPWASATPNLYVDGYWGDQTYSNGTGASNWADWHGFLCVQLADISVSYQSLLICDETWRSDMSTGADSVSYDSTVNQVPQARNYGGIDAWFQLPSTGFVTTVNGTSQHGASRFYDEFEFEITAANLQRIIAAANALMTAGSHGGLEPYSTNVSDYAITDYQCGVEGNIAGTSESSGYVGARCGPVQMFSASQAAAAASPASIAPAPSPAQVTLTPTIPAPAPSSSPVPAKPTTPSSRSSSATPAAGCSVPKLKGKTLKQARTTLIAARCSLGKVSQPKQYNRARVAMQSPAKGSYLMGHRVALILR